MSDTSHHVFNRSAKPVLDECSATFTQRAGEYQDTWAIENQESAFLDHVMAEFGLLLTKEQKRLVQLAVLIDVKDSRMLGPYKRDTIIDGIAYRAAFATVFEEYLAAESADDGA